MRHVSVRLDERLGIVVGRDGKLLALPWSLAERHGAVDDVSAADTPALVRAMLDGAILAGRTSNEAGRPRPHQPRLSRLQWVINLVSSYQTTRCIPRTFLIAAARLHERGDLAGVDFALRKYAEESWHYRLALKDIASLGIDAVGLVGAVTVASADAVCEHSVRIATEGSPVAAFGVAYVGERASLDVDQGYIDRIDALFPDGIRATRCLRVHSGVGSDPDHVRDIVEFTLAASAEDRRGILDAVFRGSQAFFEFPWHRQTDSDFAAMCAARGVRLPEALLS